MASGRGSLLVLECLLWPVWVSESRLQAESESIELCVSDAIPEFDLRGHSLFQQAPQAVRPSGPEKRKSAASGIPNYDSVKFSLTFSPLQNSQSISLQDNNLKSLCKLLVCPPLISTTQTNSLRYIPDHAKRPAGPWRLGAERRIGYAGSARALGQNSSPGVHCAHVRKMSGRVS